MKFIHAADVHIDSPLHGLGNYPDAPAAQLRGASREAFVQLVDHAVEEGVDFMVIAGDLYDGDWRDHNTGLFFVREMGRLKRAGIPVFVLFGNHDAENEMTKRLTLPDNVVKFGSKKPETHRLDDLKVALHGQSFKEKAVVDNLAITYGDAVPGYYNIGVLHTALEGNTAHPNYAPCSRAELHAKGYDYWALGHVHEFQHWDEQSHIVFPGNLQGRNIREVGRRGAVLVTADDGHTSVERLFLDVLRWETLEVEATHCSTMPDVARRVGEDLTALLTVDSHVPRAVRVVVTGHTHAHGALFGKATELRSEVLGQIAAIGNERLWLEKVKVQTQPVAAAFEAGEDTGAIADLKAILDEAAGDPAFISQLKGELQHFFGKLSAEVKEDVPLVKLARDGDFAALVKHVSPALLATLMNAE